MNRLNNEDWTQIRDWMYRNARPLDLARWQYHFEHGGRETVLAALSTYQNADGGFGHALEADSWNPNSSPYTTSIAVMFLEEISFCDPEHPLIQGMLRYLECSPDFTGRYWPAVIPSNDDYPHAPWWTYKPNNEAEWGYTPTAKLAGLVLRAAERGSEFFARAETIAQEAVHHYLEGVTAGGQPYRSIRREGEVDGFRYLADVLETRHLMDPDRVAALKNALKEQVYQFIDRDASEWNQYRQKPSSFFNSPESPFYEGNADVMAAELEFLLKNRNPDGVWNITWSWGAYEKEFAISENWWKATLAIANLLLLRNFH